jgi:AAA family ATPase
VFAGMSFQCNVIDLKRTFRVVTINHSPNTIGRYNASSTVVHIQGKEEVIATESASTCGVLSIPSVPGLKREIEKLNEFFGRFGSKFYHEDEDPSCAMIIHGGHGTGKSFLLDQIMGTNWGKVHRIKPGDKSSSIREIFKQAHAQQPSIILLDRLESLVAKDRANFANVVDVLASELDELAAEATSRRTLPRVVVVGTCVDYMNDIPDELRSNSRFEMNILLPIPNEAGRLEILESFKLSLDSSIRDDVLISLARRTYAYNPRDLQRLVHNAKRISSNALRKAGQDPESEETFYVTKEEFEAAFISTRPTAMHDINLKPPTIHWQDVGGQEGLKKALKQMITLTTVRIQLLFNLGICRNSFQQPVLTS